MPWSAERRITPRAVHIANATPDISRPSRWRIAAEYLATVAALLAFWVLGMAYVLGGPQEFLRAFW